jgi:hypothetical protein
MTENQSCLVIDLKPGEVIDIAGAAQVQLIHKSGHYARLKMVADKSVRIKKRDLSSTEKK